jgi:hypothetical protein
VKRQCRGKTVHLTYCSNIHAGESWSETLHNLRTGAAEVKSKVCSDAPFGIGLRLSAQAAHELTRVEGQLERTRAELAQRGMYVFTINGFPHGRFHGVPVKSRVYLPDWRDAERTRYTLELAHVLASLLPPDTAGSISSVPIAFRSSISDGDALQRAVDNLLSCAAGLFQQRAAGAADIALALEPEPACHLETTEEAIRFFEDVLWSERSLARFGELTGLTRASAADALQDLVGLCFDTCHAAVEFEHAREAVCALQRAGVRIAKVQATNGLALDPRDELARREIARFADPIYLHQVVAQVRGDDGSLTLRRYVDLDEALTDYQPTHEAWRVHYHVPIFQRALAPLDNTQAFLSDALDEVLTRGLCDHVEVETYTWSVLPASHRALSLGEMIASELRWASDAIARADRTPACGS